MLGKEHDFRICTWEIAMTWQDPYDPYRQNDPYRQDDPYQQYDPYRQNAHDPPGQSPYGSYGHNPTGQPGWQDPYAPYGYYGPPGVRPVSTGGTVAALIANIVSAVLCCVGLAWLPGIILAALALGRAATDPESARRLTVWAWVCFGTDLVLTVGLIVTYGLVAGDPGSSTGTP